MIQQLNNKGFTLIELIVVISILGILSAYATVKFVNLQSNANIAVLNSLHGILMSTVHQVNMKAHLAGAANARNATIDFAGQSVRLRWGYPRTNQIFSTGNNDRLIKVDANNARITRNVVRLDGNNNCRLRYRQPARSGQQPRIDMRTSGC